MTTLILCVAVAATILGALQLLHDLVHERRLQGRQIAPSLAIGAHPAVIALVGTAASSALLSIGLFQGLMAHPGAS